MIEFIIIVLITLSICIMYPILKDVMTSLLRIEKSIRMDGKKEIESASLKLPPNSLGRIHDYQFVVMILLMLLFVA